MYSGQKGPLQFSCEITISILLSCMETPPYQGYHFPGKRATKFILNDYTSGYKDRLASLHLLPLMMQLELNDIMFFIKSLKAPTSSFNILNFVQFCSSATRSSTHLKLKQPFCKKNSVRHFYFNRLPRLWNSLPPIDINQSLHYNKSTLRSHFWNHFLTYFNPDNPCTYHRMCPCAKCVSSQ